MDWFDDAYDTLINERAIEKENTINSNSRCFDLCYASMKRTASRNLSGGAAADVRSGQLPAVDAPGANPPQLRRAWSSRAIHRVVAGREE